MSGSSSTRGKWSVVGSIVSAPVRGYYYAGRVKAIKRPVDGSTSPPLYSVIFSNPLGCSVEEQPGDDCLILDFPAEQLIGRSFEPVTKALLSENQKVFITYRSREVNAHVLNHDNKQDIVRLKLDTVDPGLEMSVKLHEVRLLPSRKSGRLQEHPDYSLLANGRRSPDEERNKSSGTGGRRRTTSTSSTSLLANESSQLGRHTPLVSAHIDVPSSQNLGRKRRPSNPDQMDECAAAMVLMSLSASPRSPTCFNERLLTTPTKIYKCTWPGCKHETLDCSNIEKHVRQNHLRDRITDDEELMSGEEEFYYTEVDLSGKQSGWKHQNSSGSTHSSGPDSPVSLSEDAASSSSGSVLMTNGDNSMDSNPPSPLSSGHHFFKSNSAFIPVQHYRHLEDHEYNRKPDPAGISILGSSRRGGGVGRKGTHSSTMLSSPSSSTSHPINIPMEHSRSMTMSASFGGFSGASSLSSGFGSYTSSLGSSFSPVSPPRSSGSLSSSLSNTSNKYLRIGQGRGGSGTTILQSGTGFSGINRTSPTKRVRGETRKCRKVYGMDKKDAWCTQCKWKKACTRFTD